MQLPIYDAAHERERVTRIRDELIAERNDVEQLRRRLRCAILELVPNKWALRATLFRVIDHAPPAALFAMRDRMKELFS